MYATTWGNGNYSLNIDESHDRRRVQYVRAFIEAVLDYTGAEKVDIITHSLGVTLTRRAIKGGLVLSDETPYELGPALTSRVDTFLALAGGNQGLITCNGKED